MLVRVGPLNYYLNVATFVGSLLLRTTEMLSLYVIALLLTSARADPSKSAL